MVNLEQQVKFADKDIWLLESPGQQGKLLINICGTSGTTGKYC